MPVSGNLYHHAIEMLLKGQLAKTLSLQELKRLGHRLVDVWQAFKAAFPQEALSAFDALLAGLDRFEQIRYPDQVMQHGMYSYIAWAGPAIRPEFAGQQLPGYELIVTGVDRLIGRLFGLCGIHPAEYLQNLNAFGRHVLTTSNPVCQSWFSGP